MKSSKELKITETVQEILWDNILLYDRKSDRDYFICFNIGKKKKPQFEQISFRKENYWHLLGCKLANENADEIYNKCLNREEIKNDIIYAYQHSLKDVKEKDEVFKRVFDFVEYAKEINIAYASAPDVYTFKMAIGKDSIVGYGTSRWNPEGILHPRTCQKKSTQNISRELYKILFILSKEKNQRKYDTVEYCTRKVNKKNDIALVKQIIDDNYDDMDLFDIKES